MQLNQTTKRWKYEIVLSSDLLWAANSSVCSLILLQLWLFFSWIVGTKEVISCRYAMCFCVAHVQGCSHNMLSFEIHCLKQQWCALSKTCQDCWLWPKVGGKKGNWGGKEILEPHRLILFMLNKTLIWIESAKQLLSVLIQFRDVRKKKYFQEMTGISNVKHHVQHWTMRIEGLIFWKLLSDTSNCVSVESFG